MSGATFGRKGAGPTIAETEVAARRAAFLAEERTRTQRPAGAGIGMGMGMSMSMGSPAPIREPVFVRAKSRGTAYMLWFFLGGVSAHRFYLGYPASGAVQMAMTPLAYALLASGSMLGLAVLLGAGAWLLADLFLIPGLLRKADERARRDATESVFV
jgi:TM2 domain-containing membrane protein YozV